MKIEGISVKSFCIYLEHLKAFCQHFSTSLSFFFSFLAENVLVLFYNQLHMNRKYIHFHLLELYDLEVYNNHHRRCNGRKSDSY